jgi:phosphoglycerate dehydrogenase-like enzyme
MPDNRPLILAAPWPRSLELLFKPPALIFLRTRYDLVETTEPELPGLPDDILGRARYILGQPAIDGALLERLRGLRAILNVESNLLPNMPYAEVFARGIHVLTTGAAFAVPVAEIGLGFALSLARGIHSADADFRAGSEAWGGDSNSAAGLITGSEIGIIGFGDLGRALSRLLAGFRARVRVFDPWLPASVLREEGVEPAPLQKVLEESDTIFVVAAATDENERLIGKAGFAAMRPGAAFILLSRAALVDFDAMAAAVASGHIRAASDVWPEEPLPSGDPLRSLPGLLHSAHRAGALGQAFKTMGDMILEDLDLMDRNLPPRRCKRAERETATLLRSKPVSRN